MSQNPLVSVIIPTFNRSKTLCDAVDSVRKQSYSPLEVIVVDDGSTDDTAERLRPYGSFVTYVRQKRSGSAAARNRGIEIARGEFVAFLDADDLWRPEKVKTQVSYFRAHPEVGLLCSDAREFDERDTFSHSFLSQFGEIECEGFVFESIATTAFPLTSTVMIRRTCINSVRFNESLTNFQDIYFFMRLNLRHRIAVIRKPLVDRRLHTGNVSRNEYNRFLSRTIAFREILKDGTTLTRKERATIKRLLAFSCARVADCHWDIYELPEARKWYLKALRLDVIGLDAFIHMLLTFLPRRAISSLRQFKLSLESRFHPAKESLG